MVRFGQDGKALLGIHLLDLFASIGFTCGFVIIKEYELYQIFHSRQYH